jgi:uncharacterized membrane protein (DUF2068 family)
MSKSATQQQQKREHAGGLLAIGAFKILKAIFFLAVGIGALRLLHKDLADIALHVATALKFDPEGRFVNTVLDHIGEITPHRLKQISLASIAYSGVATVEGIGLLKEKVWAEYLTMILTASFLPFELIEILHHPTWMKFVVTLINVAVLAYLIYYVQRMRKRFSAAHASATN